MARPFLAPLRESPLSRVFTRHAPERFTDAESAVPDEPEPRGSRRRRLWELGNAVRCPVVGVCLSVEEVRESMGKRMGSSGATDFELHVTAVRGCSERSEWSRRLNRRLDQRFAGFVRRYAQSRDVQTLYAWWRADVAAGEVAGGLWAIVTHPLCDDALEAEVYGDIHLLQHQAAAEVRADHRRLAHDRARIARLEQSLQETQADRMRERESRDLRIRELEAECARLRIASRAMEERIARQQEASAAERAGDSRSRSAEGRLQREVHALRHRVLRLRERLAAAASFAPAGSKPAASERPEANVDAARAPEAPAPCAPIDLRGKTVLCVGGRPALVPRFRAIVEDWGAHFAHHDGGVEEAIGCLDARLQSAHIVLCDAGIVSHSAYGRVKRHCRRANKPCVYLEKAGASSLSSALQSFARGTSTERAACEQDGISNGDR